MKMLHELLLSLSGHPSPLLRTGAQNYENPQTLLSPAELALLGSLADDLGEKHMSIRDNAKTVSSTHSSPACRAVASAILSVHIADFQRHILEVEKDILKGNANIMGAYNIVPLSALAGSFDNWGRRLEWLWKLVEFIKAPVTSVAMNTGNGQKSCSAAMLIEKLRISMKTGYPDIEEMSLGLVKVAETAWLKQLSAWVLYGRHPGAADFFVTAREGHRAMSNTLEAYTITETLLPLFVTPYTATSILFIGKSLNHIRERQSSSPEPTTGTSAPEMALLPTHLAQLSAIQSPINSAIFTAAIGAIRISLSKNALQKLLPLSKVLNVLHVFKDFFLLERGEFAIALITAADERFSPGPQRGARSQGAITSLEDNLASMTIREGEVHSVLARTWTALASLRGDQDDEDVDEELDRARELLRLSIKSVNISGAQTKELNKDQGPAFDDLLLPAAIALSIKVPSPLDLFLSAEDTEVYTRIHAFLFAIRRAHFRLSKLFQLSKLRRDYPTARAPAHLPQQARKESIKRKRCLSNMRTKAMRPIWATIGSATFFLAEVGEYFQGEVVQRAWTSFHSWLVPPITDCPRTGDSNSTFRFTSSSRRVVASQLGSRSDSFQASDNPVVHGVHDPETLSQAHRCYLASLERSLLLNEVTFTRPLRRLMTAIDHIVALMQRLEATQTSLDIETDAASDHSTSHYPAEEQRLLSDLRLCLPRMGNGVKELVEALRSIDNARTSGKPTETTPQRVEMPTDGTVFVPWSSRGLDRLLLKFDYGVVGKLSMQQWEMG